MKKLLIVLVSVFAFLATASAQSVADRILGRYEFEFHGEKSKAEVVKDGKGGYTAQIYWVAADKNKDGSKRLDEKNPDKSLRSVPCDRIRLFWGVKYNKDKNRWDGGKIYDPTRGLVVNATITAGKDGALIVKGSMLGISETMTWHPVKQ